MSKNPKIDVRATPLMEFSDFVVCFRMRTLNKIILYSGSRFFRIDTVLFPKG